MAAQNTLGFMTVEGSEGQLRGIALITDARGIPIDFRYTDLVRPKKLERILYGDSWNTYFKQEIILESVLEAVEAPSIWICQDNEILSALRNLSKVKTVLLEESPHVPLEGPGSMENTADPGVFLLQADPHGNPLRAEFPEGTRSDEVQQVGAMLTEYAETMNILEPFSRLQRLVSALATGTE
ncbi:MAG: hypothetical protein IJR85_00930 [Synergistaceae bacterium]|nr:hypothetical protein [Synergistaceae bacterium]